MKICITGYYGMKNYGDDLFLELSRWSLVNICGFERIYPVDGSDIKSTYFRSRFSEQGPIGKILRIGCFVNAAKKSDVVIYAGGSNFRGKRRDLKRSLTKLFFSKKKLIAVGVSIGPFESKSSEKLVYDYIQNFDYIGVRDVASYQRVKVFDNIKTRLNFDLAGVASLAYPKVEPSKKKKNIIGFSPCNFDRNGEDSRKFCSYFVDELQKFLEYTQQDVEVKILCLNTHPESGDSDLCKRTKNQLDALGIKSEVIDYSSIGVKACWMTIGDFNCYVSGRLHGAISAYFQFVPFFLHEYQEKCTAFLNSISPEIYAPNLRNLFSMSLSKDFKVSDSLKSSTQAMSEKSLRNFTELKDVMFP